MHSTLVPSWIEPFQEKRTTQMSWFLNNLQIICKSFLMMTKDEAEGPLLTSLHTLKCIPLCYKPSKFSCLSPVPEILAPQHPSLPAHAWGQDQLMAWAHSAWAAHRAGDRQTLNLCHSGMWQQQTGIRRAGSSFPSQMPCANESRSLRSHQLPQAGSGAACQGTAQQ